MIRSSPALVGLAILLMLGIATLHHGLDHIAQLWPDPLAARRALFYVGQGIKGCALWLVIAMVVPWRLATVPLLAVCAWGFWEDLLVAGCRLAYGIGSVPSPGMWRGVCEDLTGSPVYLIGVCFGLLAAVIVEQGAKKK